MNFWHRLKTRFGRKRFFTLKIREPLSDQVTERQIEIVPGRTLLDYVGEKWRSIERAVINGAAHLDHWIFAEPLSGQTVELFPGTGAKTFTEAFITRLNAKHSGGTFVKALILTESNTGPVKRYFVDHPRDVVFAGNTYKPLPMSWTGMDASRRLDLPAVRVTVPNFGAQIEVTAGVFRGAVDYVETIDCLENDVVLQILHLDLLADTSAKDEFLFTLQSVDSDDRAAVFTLGLSLGLKDLLPREIMTKEEFPGIPDTVERMAL